VSGPELRLATCRADVVELAAWRDRAAALEQLAAAEGVALPATGRCATGKEHVALSVRPARWLLLGPPAPPGNAAGRWAASLSGQAAVIDLSGALAAFVVSGPAVPEMLARGCRLDLRAAAFPMGTAAATIMVQVPVTLAALAAGILLLTPATTARHLHEWLLETSKPFAPGPEFEMSVHQLCGDDST